MSLGESNDKGGALVFPLDLFRKNDKGWLCAVTRLYCAPLVYLYDYDFCLPDKRTLKLVLAKLC